MKPFVIDENRQGSELDFKHIKQRFVRLNRARLERVNSDLRPGQRDFVQLLPLLFHVNHPILPGYVSKTTPVGVPEYLPGKETLAAARRLSKSFSWKKRAYRRFDIHGLYLMGSTGTIAYSDKSDFDIWVVHDSDLVGEPLEELQIRATAIEEWAASMDVEATVFLVDARQFRRGDHGHLSRESSGSALHYLLLEEFYRTSVLLAGRYPLWWLVPPDQEANYDTFVEDIKRKRYIHSREHIDFGGLARISAEEFYGATLWLLYKSINSPYKSILKILLMEAYASEYPQIDLLGVRFKRAVYEGEKDIDVLDPYLMMMDKVDEYLHKYNQDKRLDLVRRSFYFKVGEQLSEGSGSSRNSWRRKLMSELVGRWGWSSGQLQRLDMREQWKISSVVEERKALINEFTGSYRFLSLFARSRAEKNNLISKTDLNVLGRKLYSAFERKAGKIEIVYKGITNDLHESHLSFHQLFSDNGQEYWMVYSGVVNEEEIYSVMPMKRGYSLIEIMAWCYFNKIINCKTIVALFSRDTDLTEKELYLLIENMSRLFPDDVMIAGSVYDMRQPAKITSVATFINVGLDPFSSETRKGKHISSSHTDALKYGGKKENLTLSIDQIIVTSWNEVLTFKFHDVEGLLKCIQAYMKWSPSEDGKNLPPINAFSFSSYRGTSIARRIEMLFAEIINTFYSGSYPDGTRYILGIEWEYYILSMQDGILQYEKAGDIDELYRYFTRPVDRFRPVIFDSQTLIDNVLPVIYKNNQIGDVQCFFEVRNDEVDVYVLDERGSLCRQTQPFYDAAGLVKHFQEYFESVRERMDHSIQADSGFGDVLFYRIDRGRDGQREIFQYGDSSFVRTASYIKFQVMVDRREDNVIFTLYCEDREFSNLEYGDRIYQEVANHVISLRKSGDTYPIYITDLDLSSTLLDVSAESIQTVHYLHYKKIIEERLLNEIKRSSKG
ncbi:Adenylate cyclase [hydrothermal vent metagenome]|uniref:Adenylate cyclase n=1 Tax=hydrothermal vent metagenome TaxID=652676 RepID=A0A3B1BDD8_9ZZZZ